VLYLKRQLRKGSGIEVYSRGASDTATLPKAALRKLWVSYVAELPRTAGDSNFAPVQLWEWAAWSRCREL